MNFLKFITSSFLIFETSFHLVIGQVINKEKSDCTILYNFLHGDSKDYSNKCCTSTEFFIDCDSEGHISAFFG